MGSISHLPFRPSRLPASHRKLIEAEIELHLNRATLLIARLDRQDGEPDLEDDDPAGDPLDERGEPTSDDGRPISPMPPLYGLDQSRGPINEQQARSAYLRSSEEARS